MSWWVRFELANGEMWWMMKSSKGDPLLSKEAADAFDFVKHSEAEAALEKYGPQEGMWGFLVDKKDAPSNLIEGQQFTCPSCGEHQWGTATEGETSTGHCHGYVVATLGVFGDGVQPPRRNCSFSWPRTEDAKYFKGTGSFSPKVQTAQVVR